MMRAARQVSHMQGRLELECLLARLPPPPPDRFPRRVSADAAERRTARAWRDALLGMGPLFAACGSYLSTRRDVLPPEFRSELVSLAATVPGSPPAAARARLANELRRRPETLFTGLDEQTWETRLLFHICRTRLRSGEAVTIKLLRPELDEHAVEDLEQLRLLAPGLTPWAANRGGRQQVEAALDAARRTLEAEVDLEWEAEALTLLAGSPKAELRVPRVYDDLSTARLLVLEDFPTTRLTDLPAGPDRDTLASRLCLGWLRQVLMAGCYPRLPAAGNVEVTADRRIVFRDAGFVRSRPSRQDQLWQYLEAAADHDPDRACSALAAMAARAGDEKALRYRLRQLQPLREATGPMCRDELGEHLLLHWTLAAELGFRPRPALVDFYRGLEALQGLLRRLAPGADSLLAAFEHLRLDAEIGRWRQRLEPERLGQDLQSCVALLTQLPRKLDMAVSAVETGLRLKLETSAPLTERRRKSILPAAVALLAVGLALTLLREQLAALPVLERLGAVVLVLAAGLLLKKLI